MKKWLAVPLAVMLMATMALYVKAAENEQVLPCADVIDGNGIYTAPKKSSFLADQGWTTPGRLEFQMELAGPTCVDVGYNLVALESNPEGGVPVVLTTASVPGDGVSNFVGFNLEIDESGGEAVCVYVYTSGSTGASASDKTGAAFDGTAPSGILDRAPDGPASGETDSYCVRQVSGEGGGSRGYN